MAPKHTNAISSVRCRFVATVAATLVACIIALALAFVDFTLTHRPYIESTLVAGAHLDQVHRVPEPCQRFHIYQIKGLDT